MKFGTVAGRLRSSPVTAVAAAGRGLGDGRGCHRSSISVSCTREREDMKQIDRSGMRFGVSNGNGG